MKPKTLFYSSLIAAAAMSTVPAWATNSTYDATNKKINWVSADNAYKWDGSSSGAFSTATNWVTGTGLNDSPTWSDTNKAPVRVTSGDIGYGYLLYFDGTSQTISVSGGSGSDSIATSDGGGIWVTGTGNTVTASLGNWAGCIQVDAENVLNTSWSTQLKDGHIVAKGTVNVTSGNLNMDGNSARTWFVGADGSITFSTATTISTGTITLLGEVDTLSSGITNRTASGTTTLTKQLVAFSSSTGITSGLGSLTVSTISDAGTGNALESVTSADSLTEGKYYAEKTSSGVKISYIAKAYEKETLTWAGTGSDTVWINKGTNWTNSAGETTSFINGDNVVFDTDASATITSLITAGTVTVSSGTVSLANQHLLTADSIDIADGATLDFGNLENGIDVSHKLTGTGTVVIEKTGTGKDHNQTINLGTEFAGTVNYTGNLDPTKVTSFGSASASVNFNDVYFWSNANQTGTIANSINFSGTGNKIEAEASATLNLTGPITFSEGATFTVVKGTLNISGTGTNTISTLTQSGGTLNISAGTTTITDITQTGGTFKQSGGTLNISGEASISTFNISGSSSKLNFSGTGTKTIGSFSTTHTQKEKGENRTISIAAETTVGATSFSNTWGIKTLTVNGELNVSGEMLYSSGDMTNTINGSGTLTAGTFTAKNVGTYVFSGGLTTNITTLNVSRPTTFSNTGKNTIGTVSLSAQTLTFSGTGTTEITDITQTGGTFTHKAGTLTIKGAASLTGYTGSSGTGNSSVLNIESGASLSVSGDMTVRHVNNNDNGATMNVSGDVSVGGNLWIARDGKGFINIKDGGKVTAGTLTFGQYWADATGTNKTSVVNVASGGTLIAGAIVANTTKDSSESGTELLKSSVLNLNGGTLGTTADTLSVDVKNGSTVLPVVLGDGTTSTINTGKYDTSTKQFTETGSVISIINAISGSGSLMKSGAGTLKLSGANTFTGDVTVTAGTLEVANTSALGTGTLNVASGASVKATTSGVTLNNVYLIADNSEQLTGDGGTFTVADGATLKIDISALNATATADAETNVNKILLQIASANIISGDKFFGTIAVGTTEADGTWVASEQWKYQEGSWDASAGTLNLITVPEPSTFGLLAGVGALVLVAARRRRRAK